MDARTGFEKALWDLVGPPLYYCNGCKLAVGVKEADGVVTIKRQCICDTQIIAPRKAIAAGVGGLNFTDKVKVKYWQLAAALTGRCV